MAKQTRKKGATTKKEVQKKIPTHSVEYDGEVYTLPIVSTGADKLTDEDRLPIVELICLMYSTGAYSVQDCCDACGVSTSSFYNWTSSVGQFGELFFKAKEKSKAGYKKLLHEAAKDTALKVMRGEMVREVKRVEQVFESVPIRDKNGNLVKTEPRQIGMRIVKQEQWLRPSTAFIMGALELTEPENYSKTLMIEERVNGASTDSIQEIIESLRINDNQGEHAAKPPITSEEQAREYGKQLKNPNE